MAVVRAEVAPLAAQKANFRAVAGGLQSVLSVAAKLKERQTQAPDLRVIAEEREKGEFKESAIDMTGLPKPVKQVNIKASEYYLNNRKKFVNFIIMRK